MSGFVWSGCVQRLVGVRSAFGRGAFIVWSGCVLRYLANQVLFALELERPEAAGISVKYQPQLSLVWGVSTADGVGDPTMGMEELHLFVINSQTWRKI